MEARENTRACVVVRTWRHVRTRVHVQVALDELGRGTSTSDGAAIAGAVLDHLTSAVGCR